MSWIMVFVSPFGPLAGDNPVPDPVVPTPTPTPAEFDELETLILQLASKDTDLQQRLANFFSALNKIKPVLALILKLVAK